MHKRLVFSILFLGHVFVLAVAFILLSYLSSAHQTLEAQDLTAPLENSSSESLPFNTTAILKGSVDQTIIADDARSKLINDEFRHYGSPMKGLGDVVVNFADKYNLPFGLLPAIGFCEGQAGKTIPEGSFNTWGFGIYGSQVKKFSSWEDGIETVSKSLRADYFNRGLDSPEKIMTKYTPDSNGSWAKCVNEYLQEMK